MTQPGYIRDYNGAAGYVDLPADVYYMLHPEERPNIGVTMSETIPNPPREGIAGEHGFVDELNYFAMLELADPEVRMQVNDLANREGTDGIAVYENKQIDSRNCGQKFFVAYGPERTFKTAQEAADNFINDLPSQRAYPVAYAKTPR